MKKWIPVLAILEIVVLWGIYSYNGLVSKDENIASQWGNVESSYQRRADLIPNIVNTAKGYAEFEQETLTKVIEARSKVTSVTIDPTNITPAQLEQFQEVQSGLSSALARLLAVFERYPDLKANQNFLELQSQLEGTENRINVARDRFNSGVNTYNKHIKKFPNSIFAGWFGFDEMERYKANPGSENAPDVNFDFNKKK